MEKIIERKIPGGKLIRLEVLFSNNIEHIKITGDFFLHPEEMLEDIVNACSGLSLPMDGNELRCQLEKIRQDRAGQFIGVGIEDIVSMLEEAVS